MIEGIAADVDRLLAAAGHPVGADDGRHADEADGGVAVLIPGETACRNPRWGGTCQV
jgi:hypothetical protein